jgi:hypothetical protein
MRRRFAALAAVITTTALGGVALASERPGYLVTGHGGFLTESFNFSVRSDRSFGHVSGYLHLTRGIYVFDAVAVCLNVSGNQETSGYRIIDGSTAGQGFEAAGQAGTATGLPPGQVLWYDFLPTPPTSCALPSSPPPGATGGGAIREGEIVVASR